MVWKQQLGTTARGYGAEHIKARAKAWAALPDWSACVRCGGVLWKHAKEFDSKGRIRSAIQYDHNDQRTGYLGFSHRECNHLHGVRKGGQTTVARRRAARGLPSRLRSRIW